MVRIFPTNNALAAAAAQHALSRLSELLSQQPKVRLLAATGASQLAFLELVTAAKDIDWTRVELFHLDEYVGVGVDHPASFVRYIQERLVKPTGIKIFHPLDGTRDPKTVVAELGKAISAAPIDLAFVGIGENGHLAFNDPPADFETQEPYLVVELDEACRRQQVGEGWFASIDDVPKQAISISIAQILKAKEILCIVPDRRKAEAVRLCLEGQVSPEAPASILRVHPHTTIFLDAESASLLKDQAIEVTA